MRRVNCVRGAGRILVRLATSLFLVTGAASTVSAQQPPVPRPPASPPVTPPADTAARDTLGPRRAIPLAAITVTATRGAREIFFAPASVTVIDSTAVARHGAGLLRHLASAPGVTVEGVGAVRQSPMIRGLRGQRILLLEDGMRLNNSRRDAGRGEPLSLAWLESSRVEVLRGPASVLYGSDAIGGVVSLVTRTPEGGDPGGLIHLRGATYDESTAGRAELDTGLGPSRVLIGLGAARYGDLTGAGPLPLAAVPLYDGDTQQFTGYDQLAGDARVVTPVGDGGELTAAVIANHQLDAPRTDKCQPDPLECRWFDEQFYDLAYLRYRGDLPTLEEVDLGAMVALTHERRRRHREEHDRIERELDQVLTVGLTGRGSIPTIALGEAALRISAGADGYFDSLASEAERETISTGQVMTSERGKYLGGSTYLTAAAWTFGELRISDELSAVAGLRAQLVRAGVAADPDSGRAAFDQSSLVPVASAGVRLGLTPWLHVVGNVDQGFRAPNLDDLTAQSDEGPGFQLANPDLEPEESITFEAGLQVDHARLVGSVYGYQTFIDGFIARDAAVCPPELADACGMADHVFVLVNADRARVEGVEAAALVRLPAGVSVFATATLTRATREDEAGPDTPESKIPPFSGRTGVRFDLGGRWFIETLADWAVRQARLSPADIADDRIPPGGTPGYGVVHVRAGGRLGRFRGTVRVENVTNSGYRVHGSGIDGPGFGAMLSLSASI
jgi:outer membrane receptor protein involved in Fe transport